MTSRFADMWQKVCKSLNWQRLGGGWESQMFLSSWLCNIGIFLHTCDVVSPFWWLSPWLFSKALYLPRPRLSAIVPNWLFIGLLILANCPLQVLHNKCQQDEHFLPQLLSELVRLSCLSPKCPKCPKCPKYPKCPKCPKCQLDETILCPHCLLSLSG